MAAPFQTSLSCPVLIGRVPQLAGLLALHEQADGGKGQVALITGEAGIGKSRLVAEMKARFPLSQPRDSAVPLILAGRCFEPDRVLPYAPWLDLLRNYFAGCTSDQLAATLGPSGPELVKLFPELAAHLSTLRPTPTLDPEQEKRRLSQALTSLFTRLAGSNPVLLILEDLHWSDDTSLDVLLALARHVPAHSILLLLTYRSDEMPPELASFLAEVDRERLATEFTLPRLTLAEVEAMIRAIFTLSRPVRADFLEAIFSLTEGNPFFIEEVLKSLIGAGEIFYSYGTWDRKPLDELHIPRSVQVAVQRRLEQLHPDARELLSLAAVAGRRFDFALLQQLTQRNEAELVLLVKQLMAAQLVVEESGDVFAFRHALTRQAVYSYLLVRERKVFHRLIATAIESRYTDSPETHTGDLAYHFYAAGEWSKVLNYAQRAGEQAQRLYAARAAIEHFTHALESAQHLSRPPPLSLYRARAQAYETLGEFEHARADYEYLLEIARTSADPRGEWQSLLDLGALWTERAYQQAGVYFQQAIERARQMDAPDILAQTLNRVGNWYANAEQPHEGLRYHQEALEIFRVLGDRQGLAETLDFLGTASIEAGDVLASTGYYQQAITLFRALGDRQRLISSLGMATMRGTNALSNTLIWQSTSGAECVRDGEEALHLARQIGWRSGEAFACNFLGLALAAQGDYGRAWECAQAALDIATEIEHGLWTIFAHFLWGALLLDLLALPEARRHLVQALALAQESGSLFWLRVITGALASACLAQQDVAQAASLLNAAAAAPPLNQTLPERIIWCAQAELAAAQKHPDQTLSILETLITSGGVGPDGVIPCLWRLRAEALLALNQPAEAQALLCAAVEAAEAQGTRPALWRLRVLQAKLSLSQGRRKEAAEAFAQARSLVEALAPGIPDEALREQFLRSALAQMPQPPQLSSRQTARHAFAGLTEREREVAALIALGKSSRIIADELIISERTVEKHIERMMSKLGVNSRAQIAAWAVEKGITSQMA